MTQQPPTGDSIRIHIGGAVTDSQIGAGRAVHQRQEHRTTLPDVLADLRRDLAALPAEADRAEADALLDELASAAAAGRPVHGVGARLRAWITAHAPALLERVTTLVLPLAASAAAAAADSIATNVLPPAN
ncbi:hypothetical protein ABZ721_14805 [Streptomyces sp. NPDC006733]|uniref:hypothetical protein n=1 Tax=Streptomyces sp. NPDC006733 TaxID=3155460 RepID=UPI0033DAB615